MISSDSDELARTERLAWHIRLMRPNAVRVAHDGSQLACRITTETETGIYLWDHGAQSLRRITPNGESVRNFDVSPRGEVWWFRAGGSEAGTWTRHRPGTGEAVRVRGVPEGLAVGGLQFAETFAVAGIADDRRTSFYRIPYDGAPAEFIADYPPMSQVSAMTGDGTFLSVSYSHPANAFAKHLDVLDTETGQRHNHLPPLGPAMFRLAAFPVERDDHRLLCQVESAGRIGLSIIDPHGEQAHDIVLAGRLDADYEGMWLPGGRSILVTAHDGGENALYRYDIDSRTSERLPVPDGLTVELTDVPGTNAKASAVLATPDGRCLVRVSSSRCRPGYLLLDPNTGTVGAAPPPFGTPEPVEASRRRHYRIPRRPGGQSEIPISVNEPNGPRPVSGWPSVWDIHGGPTLHDMDTFSPIEVTFTAAGIAMVRVNFRGSTGHGLRWTAGLEEDPMFAELADIEDTRAQLVAQGIVDPCRCVLKTRSYSGNYGLIAATSGDWCGVIAEVPVLDLAGMYPLTTAAQRHVYRWRFGDPETDADNYRNRSAITYAERLACPVFITAGSTEPRAPGAVIERYVARAVAAGKDVEFVRAHDGHFASDSTTQVTLAERMRSFAARCLKDAGAANTRPGVSRSAFTVRGVPRPADSRRRPGL